MPATGKVSLSSLIKEKVYELGFNLCGIAKVRSLDEYGTHLKAWCKEGMNDKMSYLERDYNKRMDPGLMFSGAKSMVVTGLSYFSENKQKSPGVPVLSRYAYGLNYHDVIEGKLNNLLTFIQSIDPNAEGRPFVDSAPMLEKAWAKESGLGWQGKHSIIINPDIGSFFFIGILVLNADLDFDPPFKGEFCGDCSLCIDSCPTGAINNNRTVDARKCIANLTIENRGPVPEEIIPKLEGRVYGCDKCQEVCPWNKYVKPDLTPEFAINNEVAALSPEDWQSLTEDEFSRLFKNSTIGRVKFEQLMRNIKAAVKSVN
jgi:epoxyqueuosine reductase